MAKFETVAIGELKHRLPAKLRPLVEEYKSKLGKLDVDQGRKLVLEKGDDPKDLRRALKAAASALNLRVRFLSFAKTPSGGQAAQGLLSRSGREGWTRRRTGRSRSCS